MEPREKKNKGGPGSKGRAETSVKLKEKKFAALLKPTGGVYVKKNEGANPRNLTRATCTASHKKKTGVFNNWQAQIIVANEDVFGEEERARSSVNRCNQKGEGGEQSRTDRREDHGHHTATKRAKNEKMLLR